MRVYVCACVHVCVCVCVCVCLCVRYYRKVISSMQQTEKSIPAQKVGASTIGAQKCRAFKKNGDKLWKQTEKSSP